MARSTSAAFASVWPSETMTPFARASLTTASAPGTSGASVICRIVSPRQRDPVRQLVRVRRADECQRLRPALGRADVRPFQMDAQQPRLALARPRFDHLPRRRDRPVRVLPRGRHRRRQHPRRAEAGVGACDLPRRLRRPVHEVRPAAAVDVHVHEARQDQQARRVYVRRSRGEAVRRGPTSAMSPASSTVSAPLSERRQASRCRR